MSNKAPALVLALAGAALLGGVAGASAKPTIHFTARERSACRSESIRYCAYTYPNKRDLISCLQQHRSQLGGQCRRVLSKGVSERPSVSH